MQCAATSSQMVPSLFERLYILVCAVQVKSVLSGLLSVKLRFIDEHGYWSMSG